MHLHLIFFYFRFDEIAYQLKSKKGNEKFKPRVHFYGTPQCLIITINYKKKKKNPPRTNFKSEENFADINITTKRKLKLVINIQNQ